MPWNFLVAKSFKKSIKQLNPELGWVHTKEMWNELFFFLEIKTNFSGDLKLLKNLKCREGYKGWD